MGFVYLCDTKKSDTIEIDYNWLESNPSFYSLLWKCIDSDETTNSIRFVAKDLKYSNYIITINPNNTNPNLSDLLKTKDWSINELFLIATIPYYYYEENIFIIILAYINSIITSLEDYQYALDNYIGKIQNKEWIDFMINTLNITIDPRIYEYVDACTYIEDNFNYASFNNCCYIFKY